MGPAQTQDMDKDMDRTVGWGGVGACKAVAVPQHSIAQPRPIGHIPSSGVLAQMT